MMSYSKKEMALILGGTTTGTGGPGDGVGSSIPPHRTDGNNGTSGGSGGGPPPSV